MAKPNKKPERSRLTKAQIAGAGVGAYLVYRHLRKNREEEKAAAFAGAFLDEMGKLGYSTNGHPDWKTFKNHKVALTPQERAQVMSAKAVWHHGPGGGATPAVSKAVIDGKTWYETHTHRAINFAPTLKGAIGRYHSFIKSTA